ncbi:hypothetical protein SSX86_032205 [Deinandra increscens subsp. villosa]|uniref:Uncharacterized protein n=1 Tax=Deinandra increscens subsp. villosa TaxID=3103831 RepID=A0AAP0C5D1_9ASTR
MSIFPPNHYQVSLHVVSSYLPFRIKIIGLLTPLSIVPELHLLLMLWIWFGSHFTMLNSKSSKKGEEYKLFRPDQPEFVRMAAKFGATIVPFRAIEDDIFKFVRELHCLFQSRLMAFLA